VALFHDHSPRPEPEHRRNYGRAARRRAGFDVGGVAAAEDSAVGVAAEVRGDYEIVRELGRGGLRIAFEALDRRLDLRVPVKMIQFNTGSNAAIERSIETSSA